MSGYDREKWKADLDRKPTCACEQPWCRIDPADGLPTHVLFLDFDGVLNASYGWKRDDPPDSNYMTPECMGELGRVLGACPHVQIVISSTWRRYHTIDELKGFLNGFELPGHRIIGRTPMRFSEGVRGHEIQAWLDDHPHVKRFVIVDDDADMVHLMPKLVRTDAAVGLTKEKAEEIIGRFS